MGRGSSVHPRADSPRTVPPTPSEGSRRSSGTSDWMFAHLAVRYERFNHVASLGQRPRLAPLRALGARPVPADTGNAGARHRMRHRRVRPSRRPPLPHGGRGRVRFHPRDGRAGAGPGPPPRAVRPSRTSGRRTRWASPSADEAFDLVTNAFVARNLRDLPSAFRELRRVLKPGGVLVTLEISEHGPGVRTGLSTRTSTRVVPLLRTGGRERGAVPLPARVAARIPPEGRGPAADAGERLSALDGADLFARDRHGVPRGGGTAPPQSR